MRRVVVMIAGATLGLAAMAGAAPRDRAKPAVKPLVSPFELQDVRLLDGPFKHAQELDHQYLLDLDADRLLHDFRVQAGLPSTAKPLGGWEAPDCELRGHFVGHYLSACAQMYASTGDTRLKKKADYIVAELAKCQAKMGTGYLSAFPESFIDRVIAVKQVWAPWYTLHKIHAGLLDMYNLTGSKQALQVAARMGDWVKSRMDPLTDAQIQAMLTNEHGGMNESLANLYAATGQRKYLELSQRFNHHAVMDPLSQDRDILTGIHANTQIPKFIGAAREYELTGDAWLAEAARYFWQVVSQERSYVIGGHSDNEHFTPKEHLSTALGTNTTETCNTYNMLKLTQHLYTWDPQARYMDFYERALYNHILASQNPETGMMCYYVPLRSGTQRAFNTPNDSFWCCTGTGVENHAHYGAGIYYHGKSELDVALFIASTVNWKEKGVTLTQNTSFPTEPRSTLAFTCGHPTEFDLKIRHPYWAGEGFKVTLNGQAVSDNGAPGSFVTLHRRWQTGDRVEIDLPMTLRTEAFKDNPNRLAYMYGPLVLAAPLRGGQQVPVAVPPTDNLTADLKPVPGKPLTFTAPATDFREGMRTPALNITLAPFYALYNTRNVVYWDVYSPAAWQQKQDQYLAEQARQKALEARTVDTVIPGNEQNERDHRLIGDKDSSGPAYDQAYRHAPDGWFSWTLKVLPATPQQLVVTYWGGDSGGRTFDILVDGVKLTTESLVGKRPDAFFDQPYDLPADLLKGKAEITVRFQAHPGNIAGGVFRVRVMKAL